MLDLANRTDTRHGLLDALKAAVTRTYSNRFAAHVLDYQQVYALAKERR